MLKKKICANSTSATRRSPRDIEITSFSTTPPTIPRDHNKSESITTVPPANTTDSKIIESTNSTSEATTSPPPENNCASQQEDCAIFFLESKFFYDEQTENLKKDIICKAREKIKKTLDSQKFNHTIELCKPAIRGWYFFLSASIFGIPPILHTTWTLKAIMSLYSANIYRYNHQFLESNIEAQTGIVLLACIGVPFIIFVSLFFRSGH